MSKLAVFLFALASLGLAQPISTVRGSLSSDQPLPGNQFTVALTDLVSHKSLDRAFVAGDGSFEFRDVPPGSYQVELVTLSGDVVVRTTTVLHLSGDRIELAMPTRAVNKPGGLVSVNQLLHPMTGKSKRLFAEGEKAAAAGNYPKAIELFERTIDDPGAAPIAHMNIGVAHMRSGHAELAVPELKTAAGLSPNNAQVRTNLAYAMVLTNNLTGAEEHARQAIHLDPNNAKAHWILGSILLAGGTKAEEGLQSLHFASQEIPKARIALAQYYERKGQPEAAARELREMLPTASAQERSAVEQWLHKLSAQ